MSGPHRGSGRARRRGAAAGRHRRWWQAAAIGGAVAAVTASVWQGPAALASSTSSTPALTVAPVLLLGEGSFDVSEEIHDWDVGLFGKTGALSTDYLADGGFIGKQDYLAGTAD